MNSLSQNHLRSNKLLLHFTIALEIMLSGFANASTPLGLESAIITESKSANNFALVENGQASTLWIDSNDWPGVLRASRDLQSDIQRVSSILPDYNDQGLLTLPANTPIIIGTLGHSELIDTLASSGKLDTFDLVNKWESFVIATVDDPMPGVDQALVIAGSDKRGTIYGIYELSEQLGVSPWYWWADVPPQTRTQAYVTEGRYASGEPAVKYRGIFINDEAPALTNWSNAKFGDRNQHFYTKVFELLLRLRANYLWPAMWSDAFNEDDPENPALADEYGIVMGTSHHEPMIRAKQEWSRHKLDYGNAEWDYESNAEGLKQFWRDGINRNKNYENLVTIGMRGDGDAPLLAQANIDLLQSITSDQRLILEEETGLTAESIPQVWTLYKEVLEYYDLGMTVPDDVTLLWCDDNWGNIRRLPSPTATPRAGGSGVYYHFDYVGGPRSYTWINTNPLPKIQEQMNLAYEYGASEVWIVNVGDLKPMEVPMEFFLRMAWDPSRWSSDLVDDYLVAWATREFGASYASEIATLVAKYTKYNARRKPELLSPDTYSLLNYREAERIVEDWDALVLEAEEINSSLPSQTHDAFYQLVLHPIEASANLNDLYITAAKNNLYAQQERASTDTEGAKVQALFQKDADLTNDWDTELANGKWEHLMDQIHIGYTSWNSPSQNILPSIDTYPEPTIAEIGVALEGSETPLSAGAIGILPTLYSEAPDTTRYIEIFRKGTLESTYSISANQPWVIISNASGIVGDDVRSEIGIDWNRVPSGSGEVLITVQSENNETARTIRLALIKSPQPPVDAPTGFLDAGGYIAIEAPNFDRAIDSSGIEWHILPDHGRSLGAVTPFPAVFAPISLNEESPHLEYDLYLGRRGEIPIHLIVSPTLNFIDGLPLRCALSLDDGDPQLVEFGGLVDDATWVDSVRDAVRRITSYLDVAEEGFHTLKIWAVDPGLVLQRIEVDTGNLLPSYLGPLESPKGQRLASEDEMNSSSRSMVVQAESGIIGSEFITDSSSTPAYISIGNDNFNNAPSSPARVASYEVTFPSAGVYRLFARIRIGSGGFNDDSIYIGRNFGVKEPTNTSHWVSINGLSGVGHADFSAIVSDANNSGQSGTGIWKWIDVSELSGILFTVSTEMTQTLQIGGRETGFDIDKFVFGPAKNQFTVSDLMQGNSGTTLSASPITLEAESSSTGSNFITSSSIPAYISINNTVAAANPDTSSRVARFTASFPIAGQYRLFARIRVGPSTYSDDSFFIGNGFGAKNPSLNDDWITLNNLTGIGFSKDSDAVVPELDGSTGNSVWKWIDCSKLSGLLFELVSGELTQTFDIAGREDGLDIDKLVFAPANYTYTVRDLDLGSPGTAHSTNPFITVNLTDQRQTIDGFGASSAWTAANLSDEEADLFFSTTTGLGLSLLRLRITSDGSTIETATAQKAIERGVTVWATPWTPPAEWKSNNSRGNGGTLLPEFYDDWATRLANFVVNMDAAGVPLAAISAQNEPNYTATWESCVWTPTELANFVRDYLGPELEARSLPTRVIAAEPLGWSQFPEYADALINDETTRQYISHLATHSYEGTETPYPARESYGIPLWQTEFSDSYGTNIDPTINSGLRTANRIHKFLTIAEGNAWHYWWLRPNSNDAPDDTGALLDSSGMTKRGWTLGNWARFVRPGTKRVQVYGSTDTLQVTAFIAPESKQFTVVVVNHDDSSHVISVSIEGDEYSELIPWETSAEQSLQALPSVLSDVSGDYQLNIPSRSITTFVSQINQAPTALSIDWTNILENLPAGSNIGNLSTSDPDPLDQHTYSLITGTGDTNNSVFKISGAQLQSNASFDYELGSNRFIRIRSVDSGGLKVEQTFTIDILNDTNEYTDWAKSLPEGTHEGETIQENQSLPNLLIYAFGSSTEMPFAREVLPAINLNETDNTIYTLQLPDPRPNDIRYEIFHSPELESWNRISYMTGNGNWQGDSIPTNIPLGDTAIQVELPIEINEDTAFYQLKIQQVTIGDQ